MRNSHFKDTDREPRRHRGEHCEHSKREGFSPREGERRHESFGPRHEHAPHHRGRRAMRMARFAQRAYERGFEAGFRVGRES